VRRPATRLEAFPSMPAATSRWHFSRISHPTVMSACSTETRS
jgi:hypothetical protein